VDQGLFALDQEFVGSFRLQRPPFGFGGLGEMVYFRTYSRNKPDGTKERWADTVERVVNGSFRLQQEWAQQEQRAWHEAHAQRTAQDMFERIFTMKFTPPGRGLWAMGTAITEDKKLYAALNNCAFVSTADMADDPTAPFCFLMDASMLGVGVGFDTHGAGLVRVQAQRASNGACDVQFVVPDSREGWVESVRLLLLEYFGPGEQAGPCSITFDYSSIRAAGLPVRGPATPPPLPPCSRAFPADRPARLVRRRRCCVHRLRPCLDSDQFLLTLAPRAAAFPRRRQQIKGFGGVSSGAGSLRELHCAIRDTLEPMRGSLLTVTAIVDIMNLIGRCVVSANVRRSAEIAFGDPEDEEYIDLKNYAKNPRRAAFGWTSNNSIFAKLGMDYEDACERVRLNGEPGFAWLENMQQWGRMQGEADFRDHRASGGNPCLEQTLESFELCCLVSARARSVPCCRLLRTVATLLAC
jgi:hypothetical protein